MYVGIVWGSHMVYSLSLWKQKAQCVIINNSGWCSAIFYKTWSNSNMLIRSYGQISNKIRFFCQFWKIISVICTVIHCCIIANSLVCEECWNSYVDDQLIISVAVHGMKLFRYKENSSPEKTYFDKVSLYATTTYNCFLLNWGQGQWCYTGHVLKQCEQATLPEAAKWLS